MRDLVCAAPIRLTSTARVVLDDGDHIFLEYLRQLRWDEQLPGYVFLKWVHNNRHNTQSCDNVHISPDPNDPGSFLEFPADPELAAFDRDDRKFVAVALAHAERPPVLNAVDTDWWIFRNVLARNGVRVEFLCEREVSALAEEKHS